MSRSNPTETVKNPSTRFYDWSGSEGKFKYYDKEEKKNVLMPLPFTFIVLDILSTCKGYNDAEQLGYYSNEVRNTKTDMITVRTSKGVVMTGLYEQVKEKLAAKGLKYFQSVYIAFKEGKELVLANIQLGGSGLSSFIEFCSDKKIMEIAVTVKRSEAKKKGATKYFEPVYEVVKIAEATDKLALELDKELQEYLTAYLAKNVATSTEPVLDENQDNGLNKATKKEPVKSEVKVAEVDEGFKYNDDLDGDDTPF